MHHKHYMFTVTDFHMFIYLQFDIVAGFPTNDCILLWSCIRDNVFITRTACTVIISYRLKWMRFSECLSFPLLTICGWIYFIWTVLSFVLVIQFLILKKEYFVSSLFVSCCLCFFIVCYYFEIKHYCPKLDERLSPIKHVQQRYIWNVSVPGQKPVFFLLSLVSIICVLFCVYDIAFWFCLIEWWLSNIGILLLLFF